MNRVKLGLKTLSHLEILELAQTISTALTGNVNFPTPKPSLAALDAARAAAAGKVADYLAAVSAAQAAKLEREAAMGELCALLTQLASYVENEAAGDLARLESAGMRVRGRPAALGTLPQVLDLVLTGGDYEGSLDAAWEPVHGANSYEVQVSLEPGVAASWSFKLSASKSSATLRDLVSGSRVWVRVRAIGAGNTPGPWSDPAVKTVP